MTSALCRSKKIRIDVGASKNDDIASLWLSKSKIHICDVDVAVRVDVIVAVIVVSVVVNIIAVVSCKCC